MKNKAIKKQYRDSDGLWIELNDGFVNRDGGKFIHCETTKEVREEIKLIKKV